MDRLTALRVLGVDDATTAADVRRRYLDLLRANHPDVAPAPRVDAALVTEAYRVLRIEATATAMSAGPPATTVDVVADGDAIHVPLPADEAFLALVDVAASIGAVSYVDPDAGLLETVVSLSTGTTCSLVISLQGRATATEAFCTVETLAGGPPPRVDALVAEVASLLASSLA